MAIIKCKMCGGDLAIIDGLSVAECEYCGSRQTVPVADNEKKLIQFERAERLRRNCEFDKAAGLYEAIVSEFRQEAEAYWGLVLCKYGIEYVDDPATGRKIPTCHRSSFDSVLEDSNFDLAMENADEEALRVYRQEAKQIENIRRGILEVSSTEKPYDIFICYKETDSSGNRTLDSLLAQDIYDALSAKGYRVFFSRITLEDKLGQAYEPYIFAALNSAKIMLAVGTCYEHYNAVWVKNEWSRYLKIIAQDKGKYLIPCYKNIDPYDIPREFAHLQGQDMGKVGAMSDLLRGVAKILDTGKQVHPVKETVIVERPSSAAPLLRRAFLFLEDGDWESADEYCEKVLDQDPENALAYVGKLMVQLHVRTQDALKDCKEPFDKQNYYRKAIRFADEQLTAELTGYNASIRERNETARKTELYLNAVRAMQKADTEESFRRAADQFTPVSGFRDADALKQQCYEKITAIQAEKARLEEEKRQELENQRKTEIYSNAVRRMQLADTEAAYQKVAELFASIPGFRDADALAMQCMGQVAAIQAEKVRAAEEKARIAAEKKLQQELNRQQAALAKQKRAEELAQSRARKELARKTEIYDNAVKRMEAATTEGAYRKAAEAFASIPGFQDADARAQQCREQIQALREEKSRTAEERARIAAEKKQEKNADDPVAIRTGKRNKVIAIAAGIAVACALCLLIPGLRAKEEPQDVLQATEQTVAAEAKVSPETEVPLTPEQIAYNEAEALLQDGETAKAAIAFGKLGDYSDARDRSFALWDTVLERDTIIAWGYGVTLAIRNDGTVLTTEAAWLEQCSTDEWRDVVALSCSGHIVGLRSDGTVVAAGDNHAGQCDVSGWTGIVAVCASQGHTLGLRCDGTVVAVGDNSTGACDVSDWTDIVDIRTDGGYTTHRDETGSGEYYEYYGNSIGLRSDGTMIVTDESMGYWKVISGWTDVKKLCGDNSYDAMMGIRNDGTVLVSEVDVKAPNEFGRYDLGDWTDIVDVSSSYPQTIALRSDGTVVARGHNEFGQCNVSDWTDMVDVLAGNRYVVGLRRDGTVVAQGKNGYGQCDVSGWTDVVAIANGAEHTVGLRSDGTVVAAGNNTSGQCNVSDWTDIRLPAKYRESKVDTDLETESALSVPAQTERNQEMNQMAYAEAEALLQDGETARAAIAFGKLAGYADARERSFALWDQVAQRDTIHNSGYTMAVKEDNTLVFSSKHVPELPSMKRLHDTLVYQSTVLCQSLDLGDIVAVTPGDYHTDMYFLRSDGSVDNFVERIDFDFPQEWNIDFSEIHSLENIVSIFPVKTDAVSGLLGLQCNGRVVFASKYPDRELPFDIQEWEDIVAVTASGYQIFGLRTDGTVITSGINKQGKIIDVSDWKNIIAISASSEHIIGLKSDGTVIAEGNNASGECDVSTWENIIAIDTDYYNTVGLKADGTVIATGYNVDGICNVDDWTDIVAICAGNPTIGLKQDGTAVAVSYNWKRSRDTISGWTDIKLPTNTRHQVKNNPDN